MCRIGDIILINDFKDEDGILVPLHPFVVIDDEEGNISGLPFDMVSVMMSSFKGEEHKKKVLSYSCNVEIDVEDGAKKDGYLKGNTLHYFKKNEINFYHVGKVEEHVFNKLIKVIEEYNELITNIENIK